jgi:transcriptional regulator with XRE-family HTH domain
MAFDGRKIKRIIDDKGLTQAKAAKLAGISASYLSEMIANRRNPNIKMLTKLAAALGVTLNDFVDSGN